MKKKVFALSILSLVTSVQLGFATTVKEPVDNINGGIKSDINSAENLQVNRRKICHNIRVLNEREVKSLYGK